MKYTATVTLAFNVEVEADTEADAETLAEEMVVASVQAGAQPDHIDVEIEEGDEDLFGPEDEMLEDEDDPEDE